MRNKILGLLALGLLAGPMAQQAEAVSYTYSFDMTDGPVLGTVSGTINLAWLSIGGSGTGAASSVTIDSYPAGIGVLPSTQATSWVTQLLNSFTVLNGSITDYAFAALTGPGQSTDYEICFNSGPDASIGSRICPTNLNFLGLGEGTNFGYNFAGPQGISFTEQSTGVPEPGTLALLGLGLAGLGLSRRRKAA